MIEVVDVLYDGAVALDHQTLDPGCPRGLGHERLVTQGRCSVVYLPDVYLEVH